MLPPESIRFLEPGYSNKNPIYHTGVDSYFDTSIDKPNNRVAKNYTLYANSDYDPGISLELVNGTIDDCKGKCDTNSNCAGFVKNKNLKNS